MARTRADQLIELGIRKVSMRLLLPSKNGEDHVVSVTGLIEGEQEWEDLRQALYNDLTAGYNGRYLVIPKGVAVITLRLDTPNLKV